MFLSKSWTMKSNTQQGKASKPVIFLFGPTASGKTALVETLFSRGYQVVNADSVQVYRYLDIGSAKPSSALMEKIPHHLVNILDPWQQFTVGQFVHMADEAVSRIHAQGDIPLITGGTAYYFKHFLYGLAQAPLCDPEVRKTVAQMLEAEGREALHARLAQVDPVSAERISINDVYRITRALEVWYQSGRPLSSFAIPSTPRLGMRPLILNLRRNREELASRIHERVIQMFENGLEDEIKSLRKMGADSSWPGMAGIGYAEFFHAFDNGCASRALIANEIERNTKAYAKRQMTFFRSFADAVEVNPDDMESISRTVSSYLESFSA